MECDSAFSAVKTATSDTRSSTVLIPSSHPPLAASTRSIAKATRPLVQPKLKVGTPGDEYEQEADRIAEQVMRMPDPRFSMAGAAPPPVGNGTSDDEIIQRTCATCAGAYETAPNEGRPHVSVNLCPRCRVQTKSLTTVSPVSMHQQKPEIEEDAELIQGEFDSAQSSSISTETTANIRSIKGAGQPLSDFSLEFFEPRFGFDFSQVRIHADRRAADLANRFNARAFTFGSHIVFGAGQFRPNSKEGQRLLAHELTHVVQQGYAPRGSPRRTALAEEFIEEFDRRRRHEVQGINNTIATRRSELPIKSALGSERMDAPISADEKRLINLRRIVTDTTIRHPEDDQSLEQTKRAVKTNYLARIDEQLAADENVFYKKVIVRGHDDTVSRRLTVGLGAKAFTSGRDVIFGSQHPNSTSRESRHLFGHDFTNLVNPTSTRQAPFVQQEEAALVTGQGRRQLQVPWTGSVVGSLVHFFWPLAGGRNRDEVLSSIEQALAAEDVHFTFRSQPEEETASVQYRNLTIRRFEDLMHQHEETSWTVLPNLAESLLYHLGMDWEEYDTGERLRRYIEPLLSVDLTGILSTGLDEPPPATLEFPEGTTPDDVALVRQLVADVLGGRVPEDTGSAETIRLSTMDIDAVRELYQESEEDREALLEILRSGENTERDRPPGLDDLIANARATHRVRETAELMGEDLGEPDPDAQEPIVPRPVEGRIVLPHETITVGMEVPIQFQVTNRVDAFRVPHVNIRWSAIRRRNGRIQTIETDNTNYIEVRSHGILNERIFEVEFEQAGTYEIHAIVSHNFYTPNAFQSTLVVAPVNEVLDQLRSEGDTDFGDPGTRPARANYDFEGLSDIGSYDEGYRYYGNLSEERFGADTGSFADSYRRIDADRDRLRALVSHYQQAQSESGQDNSDLIDWAEARIDRLTATRNQLSGFATGEGSHSIAVRAYFASQAAGVPHRQLEVVAWFNHERNGNSDQYSGHLIDHTGIAGPDNLHFESTDSNYEDMVEELFVELSEDYPDGQMSVSFQLFEGSQRSSRMVTFQRTTETLGGDIAEVAFSAPVSTAVNVVAAVLTVFPPTTGIGIGLGLTYNAAATAYDIGQAYESDTLRPSHAVDVGLVFLDVLPVIGRGIRGFTAAGRTMQAIDTASGTYRLLRVSGLVAEYGGELYMFSETAIQQIRHIHDRQITQLAEIQHRVDELTSQGAPPQVVAIEQRRAVDLQRQIRAATANTLASLAAEQAISLATPAAAARMAAAHPRARPGGRVAGEPDIAVETDRPRPRPDVDIDTSGDPGRPRRERGTDVEGGEPGTRPEQGRPADTASADALPERFMSAGRPVQVVRTSRPGHGIRVRYETDARGTVTRVWIEAGRDATRLHLEQHAATVRLMQRYQGLSGLLRVYLTRIQNIITRYTRLIEGEELLPGSRAFEAQAEIMKLPDIIRQRASQLSDPDLTDLERAEIMAEIDRLDADLNRHMDTLERLDMEVGAGYVAAEHEPRSNQAALDAGYPPLSEAPGHYYVNSPTGGFFLRRYVGSDDTPKQIQWENGNPVVRDRTPGSIVHEPPESLRPGERRTYTGPSGTTATAERRMRDRAIVIISRVGPGRGRLGYEHAMFTGVDVGLQGWERAHSQGQGTGHESSFGILYAPREVNQGYQNRGIEQHIRDLLQQIDPNVELILTTETIAHPGTSRLQSITYRIDAVGTDGTQTRLAEARIDVQDRRDNPDVDISVDRFADLNRFLSGSEGRPAGTEPPSSRPETVEPLIGPLHREAGEAATALSTTLERLTHRPELEAYRTELESALQRLRESPSDEAIANAQDVVESVEAELDR